MPLYEYNCRRCGADFEALVLSSSETVECPKCGNDTVDKKFSVFGVGAASNEAPCDVPQSCPPQGCSMPDCRMN